MRRVVPRCRNKGWAILGVAMVTSASLGSLGCGGGTETVTVANTVTETVAAEPVTTSEPETTTEAATEPLTTTAPEEESSSPSPPPAGPPGAGFAARVDAPPTVQAVGQSYYVRVIAKTGRGPMPRLCIDFEDDKNSWKIRMPGLRAWDDDVFCFGYLRPRVRRKVFLAEIIPANPGQHTMEIGIGNATFFKEVNDAILDEDALYWSESFVIAG